ncbi:hypothetical protein SARC_01347 [Sphaeroforma arctica JP610]|uniref:RRM domain-containing protein n=1 Tax=Sphaeroforma arctica JP610 TaxID=667725 RepID=A0A0L0GBX8_9EUKA|nr:hypothetical protein SARC_01347 [Sphaeroforma arctica JP610]KNC86517.1 hypothetical protein SARC_01347 [Sphaeroforma arctica JP610]|eukprot:XP_014160419.1 hypothetical protein SARC_01347 [Sphaeroforma arctica JP610]
MSGLAIFHELSVAYELLSDPKARAAYDAVIAARKAKELKDSKLDQKRKKMKMDLEEREARAKLLKQQKAGVFVFGTPSSSASVSEADAQKALEIEIRRLRAEGSNKLRQAQEDLLRSNSTEGLKNGNSEGPNDAGAARTSSASPLPTAEHRANSGPATARANTIRAKWSKKIDREVSINETLVKETFKCFGMLSNVGLLKHKRVAVLEFSTADAAQRVAQADSSETKPFVCNAFGTTGSLGVNVGANDKEKTTGVDSVAGLAGVALPEGREEKSGRFKTVPNTQPAAEVDYEASVLARMRHAQDMKIAHAKAGPTFRLTEAQRDLESPAARIARQEDERKRLIAEMLAEDGDEP